MATEKIILEYDVETGKVIQKTGELKDTIDDTKKSASDLSDMYSYFGPLENIPFLVEKHEIPPNGHNFMKAVFSGFLL